MAESWPPAGRGHQTTRPGVAVVWPQDPNSLPSVQQSSAAANPWPQPNVGNMDWPGAPPGQSTWPDAMSSWPSVAQPPQRSSWDALVESNAAADGWVKAPAPRPAIDVHFNADAPVADNSEEFRGMTLRMQSVLGSPPEGASRKKTAEDAENRTRNGGTMVLGPRQQEWGSTDFPHKLNSTASMESTGDPDGDGGVMNTARILMVGLDAAGKSTLLAKLNLGVVEEAMIPTIGYNTESVDYKGFRLDIWDVGGQDRLRPLWKHYFSGTEGVIFVVDSCSAELLQESCHELHTRLLDAEELKGIPVLVFANKQDLPNAMEAPRIAEALFLHEGLGRPWFLQPACAKTGDGIFEGLDWLVDALSS